MPSEKIVWIEIISHSGMLDFHVKIENAFAFERLTGRTGDAQDQ